MYLSQTDDLNWMRRVLVVAGQSHVDKTTSPLVGAILVRDGEEIPRAHRGELSPGDHAEFCALRKVAGRTDEPVFFGDLDLDLTGTTVHTTLEPCASRREEKIPCAQRLIDAKVSRVWIGQYEAKASKGAAVITGRPKGRTRRP